MEWASRTGPNSLSVVPETSLFHQRPGWKVAVDLYPAATAPGVSTVAAWPSLSDSQAEAQDGGEEETDVRGEEESEEMGDGAVIPEAAAGGEAGLPKEFTAGKTTEIVVQARDVYGNHRGVGACLVLIDDVI